MAKIPEIPDFTLHEILSSYHDGLRKAVEFAQSSIIGVLEGQFNLSQKEKAIYGTFLRIYSLSNSLVRLNKKMDFNAVAIIARTIYELLLDIKMLSSPKITLNDLERFFSYTDVDRFRKAVRIIDLQKNYPYLERDTLLPSDIRKQYAENPQKKSEIEKKVATLWGKTRKGDLKWPEHWSGLSIRKRAESFGPLYEQEYLELFALLSSYVHAGASACFGMSVEALESIYGVSLECARKMFIEALIICSGIFNLNHAIENFHQVVSFLENAPKEILTEKGLKKLKTHNP